MDSSNCSDTVNLGWVNVHAVFCLGQDFWGTPESLCPNFRLTFFLYELNVDSLGLRRGADDNNVVSGIVVVLNSPAN